MHFFLNIFFLQVQTPVTLFVVVNGGVFLRLVIGLNFSSIPSSPKESFHISLRLSSNPYKIMYVCRLYILLLVLVHTYIHTCIHVRCSS